MAMEWTGLCRERIIELMNAGEIQSVAVGPAHDRMMVNGVMGRRRCARFLIPAKSLKKFVDLAAERGELLRSA